MRVLLVTNDYPPKPGGIQQYLGNLVGRYEHPIRVLGPADPGATPDERVVRGHGRFLWPTPRTRRWIVSHIKEFRPDVVLFGAPYPLAQLGPSISRETGGPFAVFVYGAEAVVPLAIPGLKRWVLEPLRQADVVFSMSEFTQARVEADTGRASCYVGVGVDTDVFSPPAQGPDEFVLGCVSRFVPRKGHVRVIEAVAELRRHGHDVTGLVVGKGRLERRLRAVADRLGAPVRFEVDVPWSTLPEMYRQMSMFAMPSRSRWFGLEVEGLGIVYLEASASGLPVLAGTSGGAPETVRDGQTGFVGDSTADIVSAAEQLVADPGLANSMGAEGRAFVEAHYSWNAVLTRFEQGLAAAASSKSL